MKRIIYRSGASSYQRGIFISQNSIYSILFLIGMIIFGNVRYFGFEPWLEILIMAILCIPLLFIAFRSVLGRDSIDIRKKVNDNFSGDSYILSFIRKKNKKKRKNYRQKPLDFVGFYEIELLENDSNSLIYFYEDCLKSISDQEEHSRLTIDRIKTIVLEQQIERKISFLKKIRGY